MLVWARSTQAVSLGLAPEHKGALRECLEACRNGLGASDRDDDKPEMARWTGLEQEPIFCPSVGDFKQGMVVSVPLRMSQLAEGTTPAAVHEALTKHYEGKRFISVAPLNPTDALERGAFLRPDLLNDTNHLEIFCFGNEDKGTMLLLARLDNLGKGASGAAVQNLNLALGFDEATGLEAKP